MGLLERSPDLAVALVAVAAAAVVLRAAPRKPANQFFALFMALIAGNFLATFLRYGLPFEEHVGMMRVLERLAFLFQAFDPAVLLHFALLYPRRHAALDSPAVVGALWAPPLALTALHFAAPTLFLTLATLGTQEPAVGAVVARMVVELYLAGFYVAALAVLLRKLAREPSPVLRDQAGLLVVGFGAAVIPRVGLMAAELPLSLGRGVDGGSEAFPVLTYLLRSASALLLLALGWSWTVRWAQPDRREDLGRLFRTLLWLIVLVLGAWGTAAIVGVMRSSGGGLVGTALGVSLESFTVSAAFGIRWVVFGAAVGYGLLKYQALDVELRARRLARGALAGAVVLGVAGTVWAAGEAVQSAVLGLGPGHAVALAAALPLAPLALRWCLLRMDERWPSPLRGEADLATRRLAVYRAALEGAMQGDVLPASSATDLRALRRQLGLSDEQHTVLMEVVRMGPSRRGAGSEAGSGRLAGRYELGELLGQGASGRCRLARDKLLGRDVVVKEVPRLDGDHGLLGEARAAGRLNHPHIVTVHDIVETPGISYLVMEHVEGGSLRELLRQGPVSAEQALHILDDVLAGLTAAHQRGIVHGDLKPENILLAADGRAKLADFGSSHAAAASATMASLPSSAGPGTLLYLAPEEVEGRAPTMASDVYAFSALAHEVLTGTHYIGPRWRNDFEIREAILLEPPQFPASLPAGLRTWLERGLAKAPDARWPTADAMRQALRKAAEASRIAVHRRRAGWPDP